jgi:hypothetical protein
LVAQLVSKKVNEKAELKVLKRVAAKVWWKVESMVPM